jgi:GH25 family lysozyme M1 (1,4-beta-N-acetylmuramidase)
MLVTVAVPWAGRPPEVVTSTAWTARTARIAAAGLVFAFALSGVPAAVAREDRGVAGSSGTAGPRRAPIVARQPVGALPGIDVSHWQGTIDWAQVAASGQRFAIAKATEGRTYVDPTYATNKAGAAANGIVFGAYHFARPDATPGDAILEADHFVDTAQLQPGDLIPVLDLERTGGLSQAEVTAWILAWLGRVTERLGVRPMVYTSPNGWAQRTGDTTAVVDAGYTILWVAHWGVETPRLPANDWGGYGWTFWQYTDCGAVPGIQGCVDLDWFAVASFEGVTIPFPDQTPPTATIAPPTGLTEPVTVTFSEVVRGVTSDNVVLYRGDPPAYEERSLTCRSGKGVDVDCLTGNVRVVIAQPADPLIPGETYRAAVNPPGAASLVVDRSGNPAPATTLDVAAPTELEEGSAGITYAWRSVGARDAIEGSYVTERSAGATATFAFSGRAVTWYTMVGPDQGRASVWIDGERVGTFDQYASRRAFGVTRSFSKLPRGTHTIAIRVLGTRSAASSDTLVAIDGFEVGRATRELGFSWGAVRRPEASGGSLVASDVKRASLELTFRGTGIAWTTARGPDQGRAAIFLDGTLVRTVDNYARERTLGVVRTVSGLAEGVHVLRIVVLGEARPRAMGALVSVDRFSVVP